MDQKSKLLFITQKIDEQDDDLAFVAQWVDEFIFQGLQVEVICLEKGEFDDRFPVHSLGKEKGFGLIKRTLLFFKYIFSVKYDSVYVHMNPEYFTLGGWYWFLRRIKMYLWYTHYTTHIHLKLAGFFCEKMFAATKQSLPQYNSSSKKVVTGHGVDVAYWHRNNLCQNPKKMIMVHRLSRSKRVEMGIKALAFLPQEYTLTIYGRPIDKDYFQELQDLVKSSNLVNRVEFKGPVPMPELRNVYQNYRIMINMASETIDKTMVEAMCNGVFPLTTTPNMKAIGLDYLLPLEEPEKIAEFILDHIDNLPTQDDMVSLVIKKHSLSRLVKKMVGHIRGDS